MRLENNEYHPAFIIKNEIESADLSAMLSSQKKNTDTKCLYMADDEMAVQRLSEENLKSQLAHDLSVTVAKNGHWGSYRNLTVRKNANDDDDDPFACDLNVADIR